MLAYKRLHYTDSTALQEYMDDLYSHADTDGFRLVVKHRGGVLNLSGLDRLKVLYTLDGVDLMVSLGLYKGKRDVTHKEVNLAVLPLLCLDIDHEEGFTWRQALGAMLEAGLPPPNWVEHGHRCRAVYILREPLELVGKKRQKLLSGYRFLGKCLCRMLNDEFDGYHASPQPPTAFLRVPGTYNSKGGVVEVEHTSAKEYTMQELFEFVPERLIDQSGNADEWRDQWVTKRESGNVLRVYNHYKLWTERREWLDGIQRSCDCRELYLFVYAQALLWTNEYSIEKLLEVNDRFPVPLPAKEVESKFRQNGAKKYRLSNDTIETMLEVEGLYKQLSYKQRKRQEQIAAGQAKFQAMERDRLAVQGCKGESLSQSQTAKRLGLSVSKVKRLWNRTEPYTQQNFRRRKEGKE